MTLFNVYVTRVTQYEVSAVTLDGAKTAAAQGKPFKGSGVPQVMSETVTQVTGTELDERMVVQVEFHTSTSMTYAYAVPEGLTVRIGDEVLVHGANKRLDTATVVDVGRGGYTGPLSEIIGKVQYAKSDSPGDNPGFWDPGIDRSMRRK